MVEKKCTRLVVKPSIKESKICSIETRKFKTPTTDVTRTSTTCSLALTTVHTNINRRQLGFAMRGRAPIVVCRLVSPVSKVFLKMAPDPN